LRELHNVVKRYLVLGEESLPGSPVAAGEVHKPTGPRRRKTDAGGDLKQIVRELKGEAEAEAIRAALEKTQWRRKDAAALLGICYKALIYKSRQYGIISPREKAVPPVIPAKGARRMLAEDPATKPGGRFSSAMAVGSGERHDVP
jgi:two-component system response regulator AtoC